MTAAYRQLRDNTAPNNVSQSYIQRTADGAFIPFADGNMDYEAYKAWLAAGNKPDLPIDVLNLTATVGTVTAAADVKAG